MSRPTSTRNSATPMPTNRPRRAAPAVAAGRSGSGPGPASDSSSSTSPAASPNRPGTRPTGTRPTARLQHDPDVALALAMLGTSDFADYGDLSDLSSDDNPGHDEEAGSSSTRGGDASPEFGSFFDSVFTDHLPPLRSRHGLSPGSGTGTGNGSGSGSLGRRLSSYPRTPPDRQAPSFFNTGVSPGSSPFHPYIGGRTPSTSSQTEQRDSFNQPLHQQRAVSNSAATPSSRWAPAPSPDSRSSRLPPPPAADESNDAAERALYHDLMAPYESSAADVSVAESIQSSIPLSHDYSAPFSRRMNQSQAIRARASDLLARIERQMSNDERPPTPLNDTNTRHSPRPATRAPIRSLSSIAAPASTGASSASSSGSVSFSTTRAWTRPAALATPTLRRPASAADLRSAVDRSNATSTSMSSHNQALRDLTSRMRAARIPSTDQPHPRPASSSTTPAATTQTTPDLSYPSRSRVAAATSAVPSVASSRTSSPLRALERLLFPPSDDGRRRALEQIEIEDVGEASGSPAARQWSPPIVAPEVEAEPESESSGDAAGVEELLKCMICWGNLERAVLCPSCSKMACSSCLVRWITDEKPECPHCRSRLRPSQLVQCRFVDDLQAQLKSLTAKASASSTSPTSKSKPSSSTTSELCPKHNAHLYYYCTTCSDPVCSDCAMFSADHRGHEFVHLEKVYTDHMEQLQAATNQVAARVQEYTVALGQVAERAAGVQAARTKAQDDVRRVVMDALEAVERQVARHELALSGEKSNLEQTISTLEASAASVMSTVHALSHADLVRQSPSLISKLITSRVSAPSPTLPPAAIDDFDNPLVPPFVSHTITVPDFFLHASTGQVYYSQAFAAGGLTWRLKVYPKGNAQARGQYLSIFVELVDGLAAGEAVEYQYKVEVVGGGNVPARTPPRLPPVADMSMASDSALALDEGGAHADHATPVAAGAGSLASSPSSGSVSDPATPPLPGGGTAPSQIAALAAQAIQHLEQAFRIPRDPPSPAPTRVSAPSTPPRTSPSPSSASGAVAGTGAPTTIVREFTSTFSNGECWGYNRFYPLDRLVRDALVVSSPARGGASDATLTIRFHVRPRTYARRALDLERWAARLAAENERLEASVAGSAGKHRQEGGGKMEAARRAEAVLLNTLEVEQEGMSAETSSCDEDGDRGVDEVSESESEGEGEGDEGEVAHGSTSTSEDSEPATSSSSSEEEEEDYESDPEEVLPGGHLREEASPGSVVLLPRSRSFPDSVISNGSEGEVVLPGVWPRSSTSTGWH